MDAPLPIPPADSRQRWRLIYARSEAAPSIGAREQVAAWEAGIAESGLPAAGLDLTPARPKIVFAAPLGVGVPAERELADLFITNRLPIAAVRAALDRHLPAGHSLVDLHDVWLGEPALAGQVVAADYRGRVAVDGRPPGGPEALASAARDLLNAATLTRTRKKGGRAVPYDLRPLVVAIDVRPGSTSDQADPGLELWIRVRFDPERGVGRPEEVLAALAESTGSSLAFVSLVRERVVLAGAAALV